MGRDKPQRGGRTRRVPDSASRFFRPAGAGVFLPPGTHGPRRGRLSAAPPTLPHCTPLMNRSGKAGTREAISKPEIRGPKPEIPYGGTKSETRSEATRFGTIPFGLWISAFLRISIFDFRIWPGLGRRGFENASCVQAWSPRLIKGVRCGSAGGAAESSPRREPWVFGGRNTPHPKPHGSRRVGYSLPPLRGSQPQARIPQKALRLIRDGTLSSAFCGQQLVNGLCAITQNKPLNVPTLSSLLSRNARLC